jgi:7-cyano-7-deazaguanine synthase
VTGLLISGGLDSCILLGHLLRTGQSVQPIYVRTGLAWEPEECRALDAFFAAIADANSGLPSGAGPHPSPLPEGEGTLIGPLAAEEATLLRPVVELDQPVDDLYGPHWSTGARPGPAADAPDEDVYLPGRNALLLLKPLLWCSWHGIDELALGVLAMNPFDDATDAFFDHFAAAVNLAGGRPVRITRPLARLGKQAVMRLGQDMPLELTFSCVSPIEGRHCGRCNKCTERNAAFRAIGRRDPTHYVHNDAIEVNDQRQPM